jgi:uncharacterized protein
MRTMRKPREEQLNFEEPATTYSAGKVIAVALLALLFAALLDADSLYASISSERFGPSRDVELALVSPFRSISDSLGLNLPHRWLADIGGTNQQNLSVPPPAPPVSASPTGINALLDPLFLHNPSRSRSRLVSTPPPHAKPSPISAASPLRVWLAGDSMMGDLANAFLNHVAGDRAVRASTDVQIGTGLARPDVYNWPGAIAREIKNADPNVVVLAFGANDAQDMEAGGHYYVRETPAWAAEYSRRVGQVMSEAAAPGRVVVWVELPPVARPLLQATAQIVDPLIAAQARSHPGVVVVNPARAVSRNGQFTMYLPGSGGPVQVRTSDGIHLTPAGANRVLPLILAAIRERWELP